MSATKLTFPLLIALLTTLVTAAEPPRVELVRRPNSVLVTIGGEPVATYVHTDRDIPRPYFAQLRAPGGIQVTRNHPPKKDDPQDHATFHPGLWMAMGDISGNDYWRLKARVVHDGFVERPRGWPGRGSFAVRNRFLAEDGRSTVCTEVCRYTFLVRAEGYLIAWDSTFRSDDGDFSFGDQEEMGLGVRVATPIREKDGNGRILSSTGLEGAGNTWGKPAAWCDYSGSIDGRHVGVTIMAAPYNLRRCWWHNRDYGVFVANLFGRKAMGQGSASKLTVEQGESFRMGYGVLIHASDGAQRPDLAKAYEDYKRIVAAEEAKQL